MTPESRWGTNDVYASANANSYFSNKIKPNTYSVIDIPNNDEGYSNINPNIPGGTQSDTSKMAIGINRIETKKIGIITVKRYYLDYDLKIPENDGTSCGPVALAMVLQYYQRTGIGNVIPQSFLTAKSNVISYKRELPGSKVGGYGSQYNPSMINYLAYHLWGTIDLLTPAGLVFGSNNYINLRDGANSFYSTYPRASTDLHLAFHANVGYDNMKGCIDSGDIPIGNTGLVGNGYYQVNGGSWESDGVERHHMPAYGYCTNDDGSLADFICPCCWTGQDNVDKYKMYVYKLNFIGNVTIERL